jgi:transcriptional regulator with XRE-family HTH domain
VEKPDDILRDVGRKIREFRRTQGWTQETTAEQLGIALRNYQEIERGKQNLTLKTMVRLAGLLGVKTIELLQEPESRVVPKGRPRKR